MAVAADHERLVTPLQPPNPLRDSLLDRVVRRRSASLERFGVEEDHVALPVKPHRGRFARVEGHEDNRLTEFLGHPSGPFVDEIHGGTSTSSVNRFQTSSRPFDRSAVSYP